MLWTIAVVLVILWLLGSVSGYTMSNFIHFLLGSLPLALCWSESGAEARLERIILNIEKNF